MDIHPYVFSHMYRVLYAHLYNTISAPLWHCNRVELLILNILFSARQRRSSDVKFVMYFIKKQCIDKD